MFLNVLNQEEKNKFMEFVYVVANIDGDYDESEKELVNNYQVELGIKQLPEITDSVEDLINYFSKCLESVKKIIVFEVYGLILSDNVISPEEKKILDSFEKQFAIDNEKLKSIKSLVTELQSVYDKIYDVLG